jgi:hypothetical protein
MNIHESWFYYVHILSIYYFLSKKNIDIHTLLLGFQIFIQVFITRVLFST